MFLCSVFLIRKTRIVNKKNLQKLTDITFVSKQQNLMKSPRFDRMPIEVHIPENKFDIAVYLARNTIHQIRLLYSVFLIKLTSS